MWFIIYNSGLQDKVIDLTEDSHKTADNSTKGASSSKHPCPICRKMFYESEIESHVNQCLKNPSGDQGKAQCSSCGKEFESSLLSIHEDQCDGRGSSEEDVFPIKRRRLAVARGLGSSASQKVSYQTTPADIHSPSSSESEDIGK